MCTSVPHPERIQQETKLVFLWSKQTEQGVPKSNIQDLWFLSTCALLLLLFAIGLIKVVHLDFILKKNQGIRLEVSNSGHFQHSFVLKWFGHWRNWAWDQKVGHWHCCLQQNSETHVDTQSSSITHSRVCISSSNCCWDFQFETRIPGFSLSLCYRVWVLILSSLNLELEAVYWPRVSPVVSRFGLSGMYSLTCCEPDLCDQITFVFFMHCPFQ